MSVIFGLVAVVVAAVVWPPLVRTLPIPDHLLHGDSRRASVLVYGLLGVLPVAQVAAVAGLFINATPTTLWPRISVLSLLFVGLGVVHRRSARSMASRVRDHALALTVFALLLLHPLAAVVGIGVGVTFITCLALAIAADWGRQGRYTWFSTPSFRALGHNPDNQNGVGRLRVPVGGLRIIVPQNHARTTTLTLYNHRMRRVAVVANAALRDAFEHGDDAVVQVGPDVSADEPLSVRLPPGRYFSTIRYYLPKSPTTCVLPHAEPL